MLMCASFPSDYQRGAEDSIKKKLTFSIYLLHHIPPKRRTAIRENTTHSTFQLSFRHYHAGKYNWRDGKISGGTFSGKKDEFTKLLTKVYGLYALSNPLHSDIFPGVRKMEAEVVKMTLDLFHGDKEACGCVSSPVCSNVSCRRWVKGVIDLLGKGLYRGRKLDENE